MANTPHVEITQSGRGGSIRYTEGTHMLSFGWEFGGSHVVALLFGPTAAGWDAAAPWARGRQQEIFERVAGDVLRRKVPGGVYTIDLAAGIIEIIDGRGGEPGAQPSPRSHSPVGPPTQSPRDPREALHDHLSIDVRLEAAEALHAADSAFDIESVVARELRNLHRPADGLERALRLAEWLDSARIRQALLWASWNQTACAPHCARLLLRLTSGAAADGGTVDDIAERLGLHSNQHARSAAFETLCRATGLALDPYAD